jgi:hypothetical protein
VPLGVGAASKRMYIAKLMMSEEKSDAGLLLGVGSVKFVVSSGVGLVARPGVVFRSLGNASLVTPISTLWASPENISSDLFCAFRPNRAISVARWLRRVASMRLRHCGVLFDF